MKTFNILKDILNYSKSGTTECYWFAVVVKSAGYLVRLRYFGYAGDGRSDFWMHMCDEELHPVGWTSENDFSLVPPESIFEERDDWREYCVSKLVGYKTLPPDFRQKVTISNHIDFFIVHIFNSNLGISFRLRNH